MPIGIASATPSAIAWTAAVAAGDADRGDGVRAELRDPEDVRDREDRLHHHFHDHRDREKEDRAADRAFGEILMGAANGFAHGRPEAGSPASPTQNGFFHWGVRPPPTTLRSKVAARPSMWQVET